jgi:pseudouridine-5'-phosphate glycosidase
VKGKAITPFLLDKIKTLTDGQSLAANIQLVLSNARLGAEIAKALCALGA